MNWWAPMMRQCAWDQYRTKRMYKTAVALAASGYSPIGRVHVTHPATVRDDAGTLRLLGTVFGTRGR